MVYMFTDVAMISCPFFVVSSPHKNDYLNNKL